jgi:hypothetical protein
MCLESGVFIGASGNPSAEPAWAWLAAPKKLGRPFKKEEVFIGKSFRW